MYHVILLFVVANICCGCGSVTKTQETFASSYELHYIQYGPDSIHARGIACIDRQIFTANSNGLVYLYDTEKKISKQLSQLVLPELRDIFALSEDYFVAMQSKDESALLFSNQSVEQLISPFSIKTFLDGMDINNKGFGILMGDPLLGKFQVAFTKDYGKNWMPCDSEKLIANEGEAGFAASGSNVQVIGDSTFLFVTGGKTSRFFKTNDWGKTWDIVPLNFNSSEASGPFSMCFWDENQAVVVGGNYLLPNDTLQNCFITSDGGKTWISPIKTTSGYKSSVIEYQGVLYACGTNGIDFSLDFGLNWYKLNDENCFALTATKETIYATTTKGRIVVLQKAISNRKEL